MSDLERGMTNDDEALALVEVIEAADAETNAESDADAKAGDGEASVKTKEKTRTKKATAPTSDKAMAPAIATREKLDAAIAEMEQAHRVGDHARIGRIGLRISDEHEGGEGLWRQYGEVVDKKGKVVRIKSFDHYAKHVICRQFGFDLATLKGWMSDSRESVAAPEPIAPVGAKPVPTEADLDAALIDFEVSCLGWGNRDYCDEALLRKSANIVWWLDKHEVWKVRRDEEGKQRFANIKECIAPSSSFSYCITKKSLKEWLDLADPVEADKRPFGRTDGYPDLPVHEEADKFPMLKEAELNELAADVRENGLREKIDVYCGEIIDGRNRYAACRIAKVKPEFREFQDVDRKGEGPDPTPAAVVAYIASKNIHRRHLNTQERTLRAAALAKAKALTQEKAAEQFKISRRNLVRAKGIYDRGSKALIAVVERCEVSIFDAAHLLDLSHEKQDELLADVREGKAKNLWEARAFRESQVEEEGAEDDLDEGEEPARKAPEKQTPSHDVTSAKQVERRKHERERIEADDREEESQKKRVTVQFETDDDGVKPTLEYSDGVDRFWLYPSTSGGIEIKIFQDGAQRLFVHDEESFEARRVRFASNKRSA